MSSPYYDPQKAHEYYEQHKQLKGYEHRYDNTDRSRGGSQQYSGGRTIRSAGVGQSAATRLTYIRNMLAQMTPEQKQANRDTIKSQIEMLRQEIQNKQKPSVDERVSDLRNRLKQRRQSK